MLQWIFFASIHLSIFAIQNSLLFIFYFRIVNTIQATRMKERTNKSTRPHWKAFKQTKQTLFVVAFIPPRSVCCRRWRCSVRTLTTATTVQIEIADNLRYLSLAQLSISDKKIIRDFKHNTTVDLYAMALACEKKMHILTRKWKQLFKAFSCLKLDPGR